jgi:phenylpropionate dioxygenase-like ring-hydroxylating dioxygenase large terminal subunit
MERSELVDHEELRHHWYVVAESADLERVSDGAHGVSVPIAVRLLGADYVVWRTTNGEIAAAPDRCPHRESPLSIGTVHDGCLTCPYHGWKFGDEGRCVEVPSSGVGRPVPPTSHLRVVHVQERYGLVWMCPDEPIGTIPHMAAEDDPTYRRINTGVERWNTCALRMTDNFLDFSHFPFVHAATFGIADNQEVPKLDLGRLDDDYFGYEYEVEVRNELGAVASGLDGSVVHRRMTTGFHLPLTVRSTIHYETGLNHLLLLCATPVDDAVSYFTFVVWRNDDFSVPAEEIITFDRAIGAEDKVMLEQVPGVLPLDQHATVSVQSDKASVEWRRQFAAILASPAS